MKLYRMVLFDVFLAALFYLWQAKGIHGAKTFLEWWLWFIVAAHAIFVCFADAADKICASAICRLYDFLSTMVISAALLYFGLVALPICLFIAWLLFVGKNNSTADGQRVKREAA